MSPTIAECLEHARQCEWYAARTNGAENAGPLVPSTSVNPRRRTMFVGDGRLETKRARP